MDKQCYLPASGFTNTLNEVYDWAKMVVASARSRLSGSQLRVAVWAYREQGYEWLAVDFFDEADNDYLMTFLIGDEHDFHADEPRVPDMTEALHMAGIVIEALGAKIELGRRCNEVNKYCTPEAWTETQTNAMLALE